MEHSSTNPEPEDPPGAGPSDPAPGPLLRPVHAAIAAGLAFAIAVLMGLSATIVERVTSRVGALELAIVLGSTLAFGLAAVVTLRMAGARVSTHIPLALPPGKVWIASALLGVGAMLSNASLTARLYVLLDFGYLESTTEMVEALVALVRPAGLLLLLGVVVPISEELLFRGVILQSLLGRWEPGSAVFFSAMIFGLFHIHPVHFLVAFVVGLLAGIAAVSMRSLWPAVAVHVANNVASFSMGSREGGLPYLPLWLLGPGLVAIAVGLCWLWWIREQGQDGRVTER